MIKKLFLLRHGEASGAGNPDFDRPLTASGERAIRHLVLWFENENIRPDKIISSTAIRAIDSAAILSEQLSVILREEQLLYRASVRTFLQIVNDVDESVASCLFVGHNPTITYLAEYISGEPVSMETGGLACVILENTAWSKVGEKSGSSLTYLSPAVYA